MHTGTGTRYSDLQRHLSYARAIKSINCCLMCASLLLLLLVLLLFATIIISCLRALHCCLVVSNLVRARANLANIWIICCRVKPTIVEVLTCVNSNTYYYFCVFYDVLGYVNTFKCKRFSVYEQLFLLPLISLLTIQFSKKLLNIA